MCFCFTDQEKESGEIVRERERKCVCSLILCIFPRCAALYFSVRLYRELTTLWLYMTQALVDRVLILAMVFSSTANTIYIHIYLSLNKTWWYRCNQSVFSSTRNTVFSVVFVVYYSLQMVHFTYNIQAYCNVWH